MIVGESGVFWPFVAGSRPAFPRNTKEERCVHCGWLIEPFEGHRDAGIVPIGGKSYWRLGRGYTHSIMCARQPYVPYMPTVRRGGRGGNVCWDSAYDKGAGIYEPLDQYGD